MRELTDSEIYALLVATTTSGTFMENKYLREEVEFARAVIAADREANRVQDGWVSVKDRRPYIDLDTNYLGVNDAGYMAVFNSMHGVKFHATGIINLYCSIETAEHSEIVMSGLTHWIPLPTPPKEPET